MPSCSDEEMLETCLKYQHGMQYSVPNGAVPSTAPVLVRQLFS
jgi:hypothetical protein